MRRDEDVIGMPIFELKFFFNKNPIVFIINYVIILISATLVELEK